jgi:hypothetical protein
MDMKMPALQSLYSLSVTLMLLLFAGCEKVIELDLGNATPLIVIEGGVSNQVENQWVRVSKTSSFNEPNAFLGVKGAKVTVSSGSGRLINFTETTDGLYRSPRFRGVPGNSYKLQVTVEGKTFTASSVMPMVVQPDSIYFRKLSFFGNTRVFPAVYYTDPAGTQNQYRYIVKLNNKLIREYVTDDRFTNGNATSDLITFDGDGVMEDDRVDIEMQCIDRNVFKYYYAISQVNANNGPPVAPANPDSNIDNGALGVFSAYTRSIHSITRK